MKKYFLLLFLLSACSLLNPNGIQNTVTSGLDVKKYPFRFVEVMPNPLGTDIGNEYAIIRNTSSDSAAIIDWYYTGRLVTRFSFGVAGKVPGGWEAKIGTGRTNEWLHNTADTLRLYAPDKTLVQTIIWANVAEGQIIKP
jgi:hypothetical protein